MYEFKKQNSTPLPIERVEDEHDEEKDFMPSFWWNNRRYHLDTDFEPVRRNPACGDDGIPEEITLVESDRYSDPMYLAFPDEGHVDIYKEKEK